MPEKITASPGVEGDSKWKRFYERFPRRAVRVGERTVEVPEPDAIVAEAQRVLGNPGAEPYDAATLTRIADHLREFLKYAELAHIARQHSEDWESDTRTAVAAYEKATQAIFGKNLDKLV